MLNWKCLAKTSRMSVFFRGQINVKSIWHNKSNFCARATSIPDKESPSAVKTLLIFTDDLSVELLIKQSNSRQSENCLTVICSPRKGRSPNASWPHWDQADEIMEKKSFVILTHTFTAEQRTPELRKRTKLDESRGQKSTKDYLKYI